MMAMFTTKRKTTEADSSTLPDLTILAAGVAEADAALAAAVTRVREIENAAGSSSSIERDRALLALDPSRRRVVECRVAADDVRRALEAAEAVHREARRGGFEARLRALLAELNERLAVVQPLADEIEDLRDEAWHAGVKLEPVSFAPLLSETPHRRAASMLDAWRFALRRDGWLDS